MGNSPTTITEITDDRPVMNFTENDSPQIREHFPFPSIRVAQEIALQAIEKAHRENKKYVVLEIPTGGGKCFALGTKVLMYNGNIRSVEDVGIGDLLMGDDSTPRIVLSTTSGQDQMFDVVPIKGESYRVNSFHVLSLKLTKGIKTNGSGYHNILPTVPYYLRTGFKTTPGNILDIPLNEYLLLSKTQKHILKGYRVGVCFPEQSLALDPYFMGLWLGDGSSDGPEVTSADFEVIHWLYQYAYDQGLRITTYFHNNCGSYSISSGIRGGKNDKNTIMNSLRALGVINNKHIPHSYLCNSFENRLKLLAGLIDSDGSRVHGSGYDFVFKIEELARGVAYLCRSLGLAAYMKPCQKTCTNAKDKPRNTYFRIGVSGGDILSYLPVKVPRKRPTGRLQIKDVLVTGITVVPAGYGEYFGLEVNGNGRFLLSDFTVVHNSGIGVAAGSWAKTVRVSGNFEPGAYYCSPQKSLTAQLMGDFEKNGLAELKGRANYDCGYHFPEDEGGELMSCEETDFFYPEHAEKGGCHGYKAAKEAFCSTPLGTTNFAYYLSESNFVGQLKDRTMLILDEAHNAEQQILGLANIEISKWRCEEVGIDFMSLPFIKADAAGRGVALDYLNETFRPAAVSAIQELTSKAEELRDKKLMKDAAKMKKKAGGLERFLQSLDMFLKSENFNDWMVWSESEAKACPECRTKFKFAGKTCYRCGAPVPLKPAKMVIKPLTATLFADKLLFSKADMVILMSATILDFDTFMRNLGIKREDAVTLAMDSDFPLENRPIYYKPVANMSSKTIEAAKPLIAAECAKILRKHANDKGIIHTHTFAITKYIVDYLTRQGFGKRILTHDENSPKGTRELIIEEHKRRVDEPTVIISPSMTEGLDLKDDLGRFGIVCKVPYEFMTDYVKARMARDGDWYNWTTALRLQQATGRTVRHNKDKAEHYIIDAQFGVFIQRAGKMFSPWWSKSILFPGDYKEDW